MTQQTYRVPPGFENYFCKLLVVYPAEWLHVHLISVLDDCWRSYHAEKPERISAEPSFVDPPTWWEHGNVRHPR